MTWQLATSQYRNFITRLLRGISCCDLCGANLINQDNSLEENLKVLQQSLVCHHCLQDLPYFKQDIISGNLLSWPAVYHALPNIHFDRLFSLAPYIYPFDDWITQLKYSGRFELGNLLAVLLVEHWRGIAKNDQGNKVDLVVPVPLHIKKWQLRGFNQAHLIAKPFAKLLGLPYDDKLLQRVKNNQCQMGKTGSQRRKNLANAFKVQGTIANQIKHVLLVDDVVTTGSTASEISKVLKESGIETVTVVTVCLALPKKSN